MTWHHPDRTKGNGFSESARSMAAVRTGESAGSRPSKCHERNRHLGPSSGKIDIIHNCIT